MLNHYTFNGVCCIRAGYASDSDVEYENCNVVSQRKQVCVFGTMLDIPPTWQYRTNEMSEYLRPSLVTLNPSCSEFQHVIRTVQQNFSATGDEFPYNVSGIFRVQNLTLLRCYRAHFEQMFSRNSLRPPGLRVPDDDFEQVMFHGTSKNAFLSIAAHGFNTKRVSSHRFYGHAIYTSKYASYSMKNFCPPDTDGNRFLLLVHVIVGRQGQTSFDSFSPPRGCDSGCETQDPTKSEMAMIFNDSAVLPVYCVKFRAP